MPQHPIIIIGAGLSGLTLGQCLRRKGIATILYDRADQAPRYNYGITIHSSSYRPLLGMLQIDENSFQSKVAVDGPEGGFGKLGTRQADGFRCHRGRLEELLKKGLSIQWGKVLKGILVDRQPKMLTAVFEDGEEVKTSCIIGCDSPHSPTRKSLASAMQLKVLPYVVFSGKRRLSRTAYLEDLHQYMDNNVLIESHKGDARLEISVNDFAPSSVDLSYVSSRPVHKPNTDNDKLYTPNRPIAGATNIPEEFYEELATLENLEPPYKDIFNAENVRNDRVLHWLMRTCQPDLNDMRSLAVRGVSLIGDAAHAEQIIGGHGANVAIQDGYDLAEYIATHGVENLAGFVETKTHSWTQSVQDSEQRIHALHTTNSPHI